MLTTRRPPGGPRLRHHDRLRRRVQPPTDRVRHELILRALVMVTRDDGEHGMTLVPSSSHWGAFSAVVADGEVVEVVAHPADPDPSPLLGNIAGALRHPARASRGRRSAAAGSRTGRARRPAAATTRSSRSSGTRRSTWSPASCGRVRDQHGNEAIFGGSYGWASAGRFHHAQSQLHRFLNLHRRLHLDRSTRYSTGASRGDPAARRRAAPTRCCAGRRRGDASSSTPSCSWRSAASRPRTCPSTPGGVTRHTLAPSTSRPGGRARARSSRCSARSATTCPPDVRRHMASACAPAPTSR